MTENTKESKEALQATAGFAATKTHQAIYEEAEIKYGPGFAQQCLDLLTKMEESPQASLPVNHHMNNLLRYTNQMHTLSQVCSADFFQSWGAEDKLRYMAILAAVSNDLSEALQGSLDEISTDKDIASGQ